MNGRQLKRCTSCCTSSGVFDCEFERIDFGCRSSRANKRREVRKRGWERASGKVKGIELPPHSCETLCAPVRATVQILYQAAPCLEVRARSREGKLSVDKSVCSMMYDNGDYSGRSGGR